MNPQNNSSPSGTPTSLAIGDAFIRHTMATQAIRNIDLLYDMKPSADHGWCGLLVGPTGSGKSAVLRAFCAKHKPSRTPHLIQPVLSVRLPDKCNTRTLSEVLLIEQKDPAATKRSSIPEVQRAAVEHLVRQKTRLIIFDEAQHATKGDTYEAANFFKHILNASNANILFAGLPSTDALMENDQLDGRAIIEIELRAFDWWGKDQKDQREFLGVLKQFQKMLSLPLLGFDLTDEDTAWRLAYGSKGLLRPVVKFLKLLEKYAEQEGGAFIEKPLLEIVWGRLPRKHRLSDANPFSLPAVPKPWRPAGRRTGERD